MKAYHGTNADFDSFDASYFGQNTNDNATNESYAETARLGFWFTDNAEMAGKVYDKVLTCELAIENPYHIESLEMLANWIECSCMSADEIREMLEADDYDGIIIDNDEEFEGESYIAFSASQITIL